MKNFLNQIFLSRRNFLEKMSQRCYEIKWIKIPFWESNFCLQSNVHFFKISPVKIFPSVLIQFFFIMKMVCKFFLGNYLFFWESKWKNSLKNFFSFGSSFPRLLILRRCKRFYLGWKVQFILKIRDKGKSIYFINFRWEYNPVWNLHFSQKSFLIIYIIQLWFNISQSLLFDKP